MISPTIGRVVWYKRTDLSDQFLSAQVAYVHSDTLVKLGFLHPDGVHSRATSVQLFQGSAEECPEGHCCWMPYQQKQAAKESNN